MAKLTPRQRTTVRTLRARMTDAELHLWRALRHHQIHGARFRKQHPIGAFVADFACAEHKLVIEVDGGQHADRELTDAARTEYLRKKGWRVLRYWNNDVFERREGVLGDIAGVIEAGLPSTRPPP